MKTIPVYLLGETLFTNSSEAYTLYKKSSFGEVIEGKIKYSVLEVLFLLDTKKIEVISKNKKISKEELLKKFIRLDKRIQIKYPVYKDLRKKGYVVKTALKFGADFRVYEKGAKPGTKHSKWIVFVDSESKHLTWHDFSAKNRVANSTKKNLLIAIVDEEGDITYYEIKWLKP